MDTECQPWLMLFSEGPVELGVDSTASSSGILEVTVDSELAVLGDGA
jgi:hypothetical protein